MEEKEAPKTKEYYDAYNEPERVKYWIRKIGEVYMAFGKVRGPKGTAVASVAPPAKTYWKTAINMRRRAFRAARHKYAIGDTKPPCEPPCSARTEDNKRMIKKTTQDRLEQIILEEVQKALNEAPRPNFWDSGLLGVETALARDITPQEAVALEKKLQFWRKTGKWPRPPQKPRVVTDKSGNVELAGQDLPGLFVSAPDDVTPKMAAAADKCLAKFPKTPGQPVPAGRLKCFKDVDDEVRHNSWLRFQGVHEKCKTVACKEEHTESALAQRRWRHPETGKSYPDGRRLRRQCMKRCLIKQGYEI